ncbi:helix-turn-helix domain-containing protein [Streptomyces sp. NPDC020192]|uniref:helix-turn-helix domain-containing protein n=1 Tax=Streptomyces sp. NPDC020192 TaxID=3365066 RepID=UPI003799637B
MSEEPNLLGEYLRARRELVTPEQVGIPVIGRRRVPGLRREEVAMLSGISAEYYLRLEQGRDRNPSVQVLQSIARVLQLDDDAYLLTLAADKPKRTRRRPQREIVPPSVARLVHTLGLPAFVEGRYLDVLAANQWTTAFSPRLVPGRNRLKDVFLDQAEAAMFPEWERTTAGLVASFRNSVGTDADDPRVVELVGELSVASPRFRQLWARHDVATRRTAVSLTFEHPQVGPITLDREKLLLNGTNAMMLVIYHPQPGSDSAEKLSLLASASLPPASAPDLPSFDAARGRRT